MHGYYFFPIVSYKPLSKPVHKVHARRPLFPNRELHTIVLDRNTKSMHWDYFFHIMSDKPLF